MSDESEVNFGYKGSMHQIGDNYGEYKQCSISIDVSVIKNMMNDSRYEKRVKDLITLAQQNQKNDVAYGVKEGWSYMEYNIMEGDNAKPEVNIGYSQTHYSTDEELKALWQKDFDSEKWKKYAEDKERELFDTFMKMTSGENYVRNQIVESEENSVNEM